jgi:hypothetical protein
MAEDDPSINDNLLDQEIESENLPGGDDMDIDLAIENALDDLDGELSLDDVESTEAAAISDDELGSLENLLEGDNLEAEPAANAMSDIEDIDDLSFDEEAPVALEDELDIPVINDVFDPKKKQAKQTQSQAAISDKNLLNEIMTIVEKVVDEAVQSEVEKISASLKHQVNKKLKSDLASLLKGK